MPKYHPELGTKLVIPEEEMNYMETEEEPAGWDLSNPDHTRVSIHVYALAPNFCHNEYGP